LSGENMPEITPISPPTRLQSDLVDFDARQLVNWLPVDALLVAGQPCVKWMEMRDVPLAEPFFFQTVERVKKGQPHAAEVLTGLEALIQLEKISHSVPPSGFIFHTSRCGSTLLANACRALEGSVVVSEAAVVEKLLGRFFSHSDTDATRSLFNALLLRGALSAFGQRRLGTEQRLYAKFSCLSVLQFEQVRRVWPKVPCVFMFRDPLEVIMSNLGNPPEWMQFESIPEQARAVTGLAPDEALKLDSEERCARALGKFYAAGAELAETGALLLDFDELSSDTLVRAIKFFGITPDQIEISRITQAAQIYSKDVNQLRKFEPDSPERESAVPARVRQAAERWAIEPYLRLKELTKRGSLAAN